MPQSLLTPSLVNRTKLVHNFFKYVYCSSVHVSVKYVPIIRRNYRTYATPGICHSIWMTVWHVGRNDSALHTRQSFIYSDKFQVSHRYGNTREFYYATRLHFMHFSALDL